MKNEKTNIKSKLIICFILTIVLFLFVLLIKNNYLKEITSFDQSVTDYINDNIQSAVLTKLMLAISFLGSFSGLLLIIMASLFALKNKKLTFFMSINLLATHLFNRVLKFIYDRPRPDFILIKETGSSLPSGHAMCSMAFYGLLIYLTLKYVKEKKKRNVLNSFLVIIILLIGLSRIYLNVHYLTDIMFGYAFGLLSLLLFINIIKFKEVEL